MNKKDLSLSDNVNNEQGWQSGAALQRFKTFKFDSNEVAKAFLVQLVEIETPAEIHMQASSNDMKHTVQVLLAYKPGLKKRIHTVLLQIEKLYQDLLT